MRRKFSNKIIVIGLIIVFSILGIEIFRVYQSAQNSLSKERARLLNKTSVAFEKTRLTPHQSTDIRIWQSISDTRAFAKFKDSYFAATGGGLAQYSLTGELVRHYTVLDGLPESDLTALAVFNEKLFIGTRTKNLLEFDGEIFTRYEWTDRKAQAVAALLNDDENRLLIGTFGGGLLEFDGAAFREIKSGNAPVKAINFLSKDADKIYVGTFDNGLWIYDADRWTHFTNVDGLNSNRVVGIARHNENLIVATDFGLSILEANKFQTLEILPALSSLINFDNRIFLTRDNGEIFLFDKSATEFARVKNTTAARFDVAGEQLFLLGTSGAFSFDDNKFKQFGDGANKSLTDNFVSALAIDERGNLWSGTFRRGIDVLAENGKLLSHIETEKIREINFLRVGDKAISAATTQGVFQINSDFSHSDSDINNALPIKTATHVSDNLIATPRGLIFTDEKTPKILSAVNRLPNNSVYTTLEIGKTIYAGTLSGLAQIENKRVVRVWQDSNSNLTTNWVTAIVSANERIFIGTYGGGIFELLPSGEIHSFANEIGKFVVNPNALAADEERLYAGTLEGAKILNLQTQKWTSVKKVLPSETVMSVAVGAETIYFGTANGIAVVGKNYFADEELK